MANPDDLNPDTSRLFVGLRPPLDVAARLVRRVLSVLELRPGALPQGVRVMAPDEVHVTLVFLGSFRRDRLDALVRALQGEVRGLDAPELVLSGTGGFPDLERPRVLWVGVEECDAPGRLHALHNRVSQAALSMGHRPSGADRRRGFRPHLTVARVRRDREPGPEIDGAFGRLGVHARWVPVEVSLFESRPDHPGERYRALASFPLVVGPG